jgi:predicted dehydrogenase
MNDQKRVRIGIVGCGSVMQYPYTRQIRRMLANDYNIAVTRAADVLAERETAVQQRFGDIPFSTDYRSVTEADDVDLVLVLTSIPAHGPVAKAALQAGKHVLVEKTMAATLEEASELVELSRSSPGLLLPAPHVILSPTYQAIWRHVRRGDIGQPLQARALYGWEGPHWGKWFYEQGGGPLFDLGIYNIVSLTGLLGPAQRVSAMVGVARPERIVDGELIKVRSEDTAQVLIDFGNSVYGVVTTGFTMQKYRVPGIEIYGDKGTIQMLGEDWDPNGYELWQNSVGAWKTYEETNSDWPWTDGLRHLVECIQGGERPLITPEHGYHAMEIAVKAKLSGASGQALPIESSFAPLRLPLGNGDEALDGHLIHDRVNQGAGLI